MPRRARPLLVLAALLIVVAALPAVAAAARPSAPRIAAQTAQPAGPVTVLADTTLRKRRATTAVHVSYGRAEGRGWRRTAARLVGRGRGARRVRIVVDGLHPATAYRMRVVATTCGGCGRGTVRTPVRIVATEPVPVERPAPVAEIAPPERELAPPAPVAPPGGFVNPVHAANFPDPFVLREGDAWYAYGTGDRFPILRSTDLVTWTPAGHALPERPPWTTEAPWDAAARDWHPWAPAVQRVDAPCPDAASGPCFVLFHVGLTDQGVPEFMHCVGVAVASSPTGPFRQLGPLEREDGVRERGMPIGCGDAAGDGMIDPAPFVDAEGGLWLYLSTDRRCGAGCWYQPTISVIPLSSTTPWRASGARTPLFAGEPGTWEQTPAHPTVENPSVVERDGVLHLLYSGGDWRGAYGMGHATATSPTGPFVRSSPDPWVAGGETAFGAGGGMLVADATGDDWLAYHAWSGPGVRSLRIDRVSWDELGRPRLAGPTAGPQDAGPAPIVP